MNPFLRIKKSLFAKLILILFITGVLVNFIVGTYHVLVYGRGSKAFEKNIENYLNYIVQDLGAAPDLAKARLTAQKLFLGIRFEKKSQSPKVPESNNFWTTSSTIPQIHYFEPYVWPRSKARDVRQGRYKGKFFVIMDRLDGRFLFINNFQGDWERREEIIILLIVLLSLVIIGAYLLLRRILLPVKWLGKGVSRVSQGNFDFVIPEKREDELGELIRSFNFMTRRISEMIKSRDQLLQDVSHELRSPLTRAKVALEMLSPDERTRSIHEDLTEMEKMIFEILESERIKYLNGKLDLKVIDIIEFVNQAANEVGNSQPGISKIPRTKSIKIQLDPDRIKIVVKNILENAIKYTDPLSKPIELGYWENEKEIAITFSDQGKGISKADLQFIFEPFYRADKSRSRKTGGYGLGLALCKKIMEAHKGRILIDSEEGKGTVIQLVFDKFFSG